MFEMFFLNFILKVNQKSYFLNTNSLIKLFGNPDKSSIQYYFILLILKNLNFTILNFTRLFLNTF